MTDNKSDSTQGPAGLEAAPAHVKLAVDLIYLLESNEIDPKTAIQALAIVQGDLESKLAQ